MVSASRRKVRLTHPARPLPTPDQGPEPPALSIRHESRRRDADRPVAHVAKDFGVSPSCLKRWLAIDYRMSANPSAAGRFANDSEAVREANKRI